MLLGKKFEAFVTASPVSVMVRGILERILHPDPLEQLFRDHAVAQYTLKITFAQCVQLMNEVVFKTVPSVGAWYKAQEDPGFSRQAVYDKVKHVEPRVSAALVHYAGEEVLNCARKLPRAPKAFLPGYRLRVLDGNHLAGTEHRLKGLRCHRAAALPGQALVLYDPRYDLITDVIPCEDAYTQERALLSPVLTLIVRKDCVVADRNFCTTGFLFGLARRGAFFVIRQHASTLSWRTLGKVRAAGKDGKGRRLKEQKLCLTDPDSGETLVIRRITIPLLKPNEKGETELHVLTNLPRRVTARVVADLYADRWTIEHAFQQLTDDLQSEIDTLAYPKAALFGFCLACVAYNAVSLVKAALRAQLGSEYVREQLSMYYLTLEVARITSGMEIAIPPKAWQIFRHMTAPEFLATLMALAKHINPAKYTKHKRGPKKKQPRKISGDRFHHVSTARILAGQTRPRTA
jgi:IS4 transposase